MARLRSTSNGILNVFSDRVKNPKESQDPGWEGSNISIENENKEKEALKEALDKREKQIEADRQREREKEKIKEIELAAEKLIDEEDLGKDIIGNSKEKTKSESKSDEMMKSDEKSDDESDKSKDSKEEDEDKGLDIDKGVEEKEVVKTVAQVAKDVEKTVESEEDPKEEVQKAKSEEKAMLGVGVEEPKDNVVKLDQDQDNMKQGKRSRANLPRTVKLNKLNEEFYNERRWPDGQVLYVIKQVKQYDLEDLRNRLAEVNSILEKKTCTKLREVGAKEADGYEDYLLIDTSPDYVTGRVGGKQVFGCVELFKGGQHRQHTAMMVMAMLGFYFEVSRHDRDKHIRVHMRHVRPDKLHHFEKIRDEATLDLPYDYKSATHPAWQFWRKIGKTGISTVATYKEHDPDGSVMRALGQNPQLLSDSDIIRINSIYGIDCFMAKRGVDKEGEAETDKGYVAIQKDNDFGVGIETYLGDNKTEKTKGKEQEQEIEIETKEDASQ